MTDGRATMDVHCRQCRSYQYSRYWEEVFSSEEYKRTKELPEDPLCKHCVVGLDQQAGKQ